MLGSKDDAFACRATLRDCCFWLVGPSSSNLVGRVWVSRLASSRCPTQLYLALEGFLFVEAWISELEL